MSYALAEKILSSNHYWEQEAEISELRFPRCEPFEIAIFECRIYNRWGQLIRIIPPKRVDEVLSVPVPEERVKGQWPLSSANVSRTIIREMNAKP